MLLDTATAQVSFLFVCVWYFGFILRKITSTSKGRKLLTAQIYIPIAHNSKGREIFSVSRIHLSSHMEGPVLVLPRDHMSTPGWITELGGSGAVIGSDLTMCSPIKAR